MTKEELENKKDEMKNRISMALKDPILQHGFEIICKNLAELEKENAELKEQNLKDCEAFNKTMKETKEHWKEEHNQLTNAKKIIKDFLLMAKVERLKDRYETVEEAEQFLKEIK